MRPATGQHGVFGTQVVAYSGPALTLLGPVPTGGLTMVYSLRVRPDGDVELGMMQTDTVRRIVLSRFRWTGSGFDLVDSADVPSAAVPAVVVSAEPATVQLVPGGPAVTTVVTIRNEGPASDLPLQLVIVGPDSVSVEVEGLARPVAEGRHDLLVAAPEPGQAVTLVLRIALATGATLPIGSPVVLTTYTTDLQYSTFMVELQA